MPNVFDPQFWKSQWDVLMVAPWLIVPLLGIAGFVGWKIKGAIDDGEIRALRARRDAAEAQLGLAHDRHAMLRDEIEQLKSQIAAQDRTIGELRAVAPARLQFEQLSSNSVMVARTLSSISTASDALGETLTVTGGRFRLTIETDLGLTSKSS